MSLDDIRAREKAATEGPWWTTRYLAPAGVFSGDGSADDVLVAGEAWPEDAEFIAHARTDIPFLLDERDKLRAALDAVLAMAEEWRYKGEFGWGAWQEGHGPDLEGATLDDAAHKIRATITEALR